MEQRISHYYESAKAPIRWATREPSFVSDCLRRIYGERGKNVNNKLDGLQLSISTKSPSAH